MDQPNILPIPTRHVQKLGFARELSGPRPAKRSSAWIGVEAVESPRSSELPGVKRGPAPLQRSAPQAANLTIHNISQSIVGYAAHDRQIIVLKGTFAPGLTLFSRLPKAPHTAPDNDQET
ncbi:hypothetical protein [Paraburkholderia sp. RL17-337-BIB-A]|uniref:hypothetical protein n=1 Tax=Paraburkholderia sp. RL17-337-BIB-A TaxID=3031636 RepID=UPI0038B7279E